jgi:hypothetical protein
MSSKTESCRVLVVARTKMWSGRVCIGALSTSGENLRLLNSNCGYEASTLQVGQLVDIEFTRCPVNAPHVEDVALTQAKPVGTREPKKFILDRVQPNDGAITSLFESKIRFTNSGSGYISPDNIPKGATGFWMPKTSLELEQTPRGPLYAPMSDFRHLKFVGFQQPLSSIPAGYLVRVSLAKWWKPRDADPSFELRCYAQLSGWY